MTDLNDVTKTSSFNKSSVINQTMDSCDLLDTSAHPFFVLVYSLVFLVGLLLNSFTMKFYFCGAQQQVSSSLMVYLKNLTAADLLFCLCLPLRITSYASSSVTIHLIYCSFGIPALFLNMYASILFMGYVAANRYLKIIHPSGTHILQTVRAARITCLVTWVFLLSVSVTYTTLAITSPKNLTSAPNHCGSRHSAQGSLVYKMIHVFCAVVFLSVLISLVFFYCSTSRRVLQAQQKQVATSGSKKLMMARRNMLLLVSIFCICFIPYHLVRIPYTFLWRSCSVGLLFFYVMEMTIIVSVLNVCLDPVVYFFLCKAFRAQVNLRTASRSAQVNIQQDNKERESSEEQLDIVTSTVMSQSSEL